ncbi:alpha/beta fold hydrolase [Rhodoblastus acidophilus]|uniref:Alpha/beta fold hydrolase n=1 Tax=Rhodoblastus acidophilus TaxID=1074 RepID=A0A6N8DHR4_RHOAC|nr:alpha/beta fold hydrolase BchO [Rhodoblastus acidophilus]MCW2273073.1 magnesium chelatase accessory protein [Rhodoblastus acidophilus]MTV29972.1 alpha/beta fold hydrolase [Rhodoblastus acidophilus]
MNPLDFDIDGADWPLRESSRFIRAGGYRWHVQEYGPEAGAAPTALLVHGAAGANHSWRHIGPLLARNFHIVAPDLPGHAFTRPDGKLDMTLKGQAQALESLLAKLDCQPQLVIGHSAGAVILARLIAERRLAPTLFVCINGAFFPFEGVAGHIFPMLARIVHMNPLAGRLFAWTANRAQIATLIRDMGSKIDEHGLDLYTRLFTSPAHCSAAIQMVSNWDLTRVPDDIRRIMTPTLLIIGDKDGYIRPRQANRVVRLLPNPKIVHFQGGHIVHEEDPQGVCAAILDAWSLVSETRAEQGHN